MAECRKARSTCCNQAREGLAQLRKQPGHALDCLVIILQAVAHDSWASPMAVPVKCYLGALGSLTLTYPHRWRS